MKNLNARTRFQAGWVAALRSAGMDEAPRASRENGVTANPDGEFTG